MAALMLGGSGPAPVQANAGFCPTLKKIVAATSETPGWKSVRRGNTGTAIPAPFKACSITSYSSESQYVCNKEMTAATIKPAYAKLVADVGACLSTQPAKRGDSISTTNAFAVPGSAIQVSVTAVEQAAANNFAIGLTVVERF